MIVERYFGSGSKVEHQVDQAVVSGGNCNGIISLEWHRRAGWWVRAGVDHCGELSAFGKEHNRHDAGVGAGGVDHHVSRTGFFVHHVAGNEHMLGSAFRAQREGALHADHQRWAAMVVERNRRPRRKVEHQIGEVIVSSVDGNRIVALESDCWAGCCRRRGKGPLMPTIDCGPSMFCIVIEGDAAMLPLAPSASSGATRAAMTEKTFNLCTVFTSLCQLSTREPGVDYLRSPSVGLNWFVR